MLSNLGFGEPNDGVGERRSIGGNLGVMGAGVVGVVVSGGVSGGAFLFWGIGWCIFSAGRAFLFLVAVWCITSAGFFVFFSLSAVDTAVDADALDAAVDADALDFKCVFSSSQDPIFASVSITISNSWITGEPNTDVTLVKSDAVDSESEEDMIAGKFC